MFHCIYKSFGQLSPESRPQPPGEQKLLPVSSRCSAFETMLSTWQKLNNYMLVGNKNWKGIRANRQSAALRLSHNINALEKFKIPCGRMTLDPATLMKIVSPNGS